jgi:transcriptional regulator GlxA family with amidase domain
MTIEQRLEALAQSVELSERQTRQAFEALTSLHAETDARINRLIGLAEIQQREIETHDTQIEALLSLAEKHAQSQANLERQWQAYINTLPRQ